MQKIINRNYEVKLRKSSYLDRPLSETYRYTKRVTLICPWVYQALRGSTCWSHQLGTSHKPKLVKSFVTLHDQAKPLTSDHSQGCFDKFAGCDLNVTKQSLVSRNNTQWIDQLQNSEAICYLRLTPYQQALLSTLVTSFFGKYNLLVGKPCYKTMPKKTVVIIPYFMPYIAETQTHSGDSPGQLSTAPKKVGSLNENKINAFISAITKLIKFWSETSFLSDNDRSLTERLQQVSHSSVKQVEVRFVRLQYPYLDSLILAKYLAINGDKFSFSRMQKSLFSSAPTISISSVVTEASNCDVSLPCLPVFTYQYSSHINGNKLVNKCSGPAFSNPLSKGVNICNIQLTQLLGKEVQSLSSLGLPALLTGIKLELAGRLTTQRSIPRKTVENTYTGSFSAPLTTVVSKNQISSLDFRQYASKNKLGAFTVKSWISAKIK